MPAGGCCHHSWRGRPKHTRWLAAFAAHAHAATPCPPPKGPQHDITCSNPARLAPGLGWRPHGAAAGVVRLGGARAVGQSGQVLALAGHQARPPAPRALCRCLLRRLVIAWSLPPARRLIYGGLSDGTRAVLPWEVAESEKPPGQRQGGAAAGQVSGPGQRRARQKGLPPSGAGCQEPPSTTPKTSPVPNPYREYPADASQYELLDDCGRGVSATVRRAWPRQGVACGQRHARAAGGTQQRAPAGAARRGARTAARRRRCRTQRTHTHALPAAPRPPQVHRALCKPLNEIVAVKKLNLESINCNLVSAAAGGAAAVSCFGGS